MKKKLLLIAGILLLALAFTACGSDDPPAAADAGTGNGGGAVTTDGAGGVATLDPVNLTFTFWGSPAERSAVEGMMRAFEALHPNVTIDARHIPADYDVVIRTMIAGGEAPDLGYLGGQVALEWAQDGIIADLYGLIAADPYFHIDDFMAPVFYRTMDGSIVGFNSALVMFGLYYNVDMFEAAGLAPPPKTVAEAWTWDEMLDVAMTLTRDRSGNNAHSPAFNPDDVVTFGMNIGTWWAAYMNFVYSAGGSFVSDCGTQFTLADPPGVRALQMVADLMHVHRVSPTPVQREIVPHPSIALLTEQVAMTVDGNWILLDLAQAHVDEGLNFGVGVLPVIEQYRRVFLGAPTVIFADSPNIPWAYELLKFTSLPSSYLGIFRDGLWKPLMREWYTDEDLFAQWAGPDNPARPEGFDTVFRDVLLMEDEPMPAIEYYLVNMHDVFNILNPSLDRAWLGVVSMYEALNDVRADVEAVLGGRWPGGTWPD